MPPNVTTTTEGPIYDEYGDLVTTEPPFPLADALENFLVFNEWNVSITHDVARDFLAVSGVIQTTLPSLLSLCSLPLFIFIIYRILTRQTALNNYQIGVVLQCVSGAAIATINFGYRWVSF